MQIAEAFVAIRPRVDKGQFQRDASTVGRQAGAAAGKEFGTGFTGATRRVVDTFTADVNKAQLRVSALVGSAFISRAVVRSIGDAKAAASALNEQITTSAVVFGDVNDEIRAFAKSSAQAIGQSELAALRATATFGALFRAMQIGEKPAAEMSTSLTTLASDLASFRDTPIEDAFTALRSGLVGEQEPLRRFGVNLTEATIRQKALDLGLKGSADQTLPAATKAQAAYALILEQTTQAQGDFQRTRESLANTERRAAAERENANASLGQNFVPIYKAATEVVGGLARAFGLLPGPLQVATVGLIGVAAAAPLILNAVAAVKALRVAVLGASVATGAQAAATTTANVATATYVVETNAATASALRFRAALTGIGTGLLGIAAVGAFPATTGLLEKFFGGDHTDAQILLTDIDRVASAIKHVAEDSSLDKLLHQPSIHQRNKDIEDLNAHFTALVADGKVDEAARQYGDFVNKLHAAGVPLERIGPLFAETTEAITKARTAARETAPAIETLGAKFNDLVKTMFTPRQATLGLEDAFDTVEASLDALNEARLDAQGLGERSKIAAQAEVDAQDALADAFRTSQDAAERLTEARRDLAEFDNPVSTRIRSLERTNIVNRHITTPEQARQKEIDLLKFDQDAAKTRVDLQGQIADAEDGVADAARGVQDAQERVSEAAQARKRIQVDAAKDIEDAERKVEQAILASAGQLAQFAVDAAPGDAVLKGYVEKLQGIALALGNGELARQLGDLLNIPITATTTAGQPGGPINGPDTRRPRSGPPVQLGPAAPTGLDLNRAIAAGLVPSAVREEVERFARTNARPDQPLTAEELLWLRARGVPGFALGGLVSGPLGAPQLAVVHGGERIVPAGDATVRIEQTNHFQTEIGEAGLEYANRGLAWALRNRGQRA